MTGYESKRAAAQEKLAQPAQEPVAWMHVQGDYEEPSWRQLDDDEIEMGWKQYPLYTTPPQPAQEPSYWLGYGLQAHTEKPFNDATPLYTAPPQRPWVGLTAKEAAECWTTSATQTWKNFEAKLKEKNNG